MVEIIWATIQGEDRAFIQLCILALYKRQTEAEQASAQTLHDNGVGFTTSDSHSMTEIAEKLKAYQPLSGLEWGTAQAKLLKYCRQLSTYPEVAQYLE